MEKLLIIGVLLFSGCTSYSTQDNAIGGLFCTGFGGLDHAYYNVYKDLTFKCADGTTIKPGYLNNG